MIISRMYVRSVCAVNVNASVAKEASQTSLGRNVKIRVSEEHLISVLKKDVRTLGVGALTGLRTG